MLDSGHEVFLSFLTQGGPTSPWARRGMPFGETGIYRFKHWATDSCKGLFGFYPLPWQTVLLFSEQRSHHGWTTSVSWVMPTACLWDHPDFSFYTNVSQVSCRTTSFLRLTTAWFLAPALIPCKDPSNFLSEHHPLKHPRFATCLKDPKSAELFSRLNCLNWCSWKGGRVIFWQQSSLTRHASKWSQASQQIGLHANLQFQLPLFCGSFTAQWSLIFAVQCHLPIACNKAQPGKCQAQWNLCWMLVCCYSLPHQFEPCSLILSTLEGAMGHDWPDLWGCYNNSALPMSELLWLMTCISVIIPMPFGSWRALSSTLAHRFLEVLWPSGTCEEATL